MTYRNQMSAPTHGLRSLVLVILGVGILAFDPALARAQRCGRKFLRGGRTVEAFYPAVISEGAETRAAAASSAAGRSASEKATLIRRPASEQAWHLVDNKGELSDGDLILGLAGSALDSQNSAIRME